MTETELCQRVESMLNDAWRPEGYCVPNSATYPHQWLWDSCFHSLIWAQLGDARAVKELEAVLAQQNSNGFVPHMTYWTEPDAATGFWGRRETSSITQPPMYGHAAAELVARGYHLPDDVLRRIESAFRHLLCDRVRTPAGLIPIFHPWESGCDDSPRWDSDSGAFEPTRWRRIKGELVSSLQFDVAGSPIANPDFTVGSISFNALTVFNFVEFCTIPEVAKRPLITELRREVEHLSEAIADRWDPNVKTWVDDAPGRAAACRTADALLGLLIFDEPQIADQLRSEDAFAGPFGSAGVHRQELAYDPQTYWRGPSWPQLNYLLCLAATRFGHKALGDSLSNAARSGAAVSGLAEYWNPDNGEGLGAVPQTWTGLAIVEPTAERLSQR